MSRLPRHSKSDRPYSGVSIFILIGVVVLSANIAFAQNAPQLLTISLPATGALVTPGQTINIEVKRAPDSGINAVALSAFGWTPIVQGPDPLRFAVTIPADASPGPAQIIAFDMTLRTPTQSPPAVSLPLLITVQGSIAAVLRSDIKSVLLDFPGDRYRLHISGTSVNGHSTTLQNPSALSFSSQAPEIASVNASGLITGIRPGQTIITAAYADAGSKAVVSIPVTVPTLIRGDLNGDGKIDIEDLGVIQGALNTPAIGPNDARDLNHDGKIDALDARLITTLCTYPRCATHP